MSVSFFDSTSVLQKYWLLTKIVVAPRKIIGFTFDTKVGERDK